MNVKSTEKFTFSPADYAGEIRSVGILGTFLFYESKLTGNTAETGMGEVERFFNPHEFEPHMEPIGMGYYEEMALSPESGAYEIEFALPPGLYHYRFVLNAAPTDDLPDFKSGQPAAVFSDGVMRGLGASAVCVPDPKCPPQIPTVSGTQADSIRIVGDNTDYPWLPGVPAEQCGSVSYMSYTDVDGAPQSLGVYLPAGYSCHKTYPIIYISHGGGGNEADWFHQGGLNHLMDTLVAEGKTPAAIIVAMNNSVYNWDFEKIAQNLYKKVIPFTQAVFNVSTDPKCNAFCGLSMGSMTTLYLYMHHNTQFDYFGAFSGGIAGGENFSLEDPRLRDLKLLIGCGEKDIAWNFREIGIPPTIDALKAKGLPYTPYFVPGGHDWYCWPQMFARFAETVLWK